MNDIKLLFQTDALIHAKKKFIIFLLLILFFSLFNIIPLLFCSVQLVHILIVDYFSPSSSNTFLNICPIKRRSIVNYKFLLLNIILVILFLISIFTINFQINSLESAIYYSIIYISILAITSTASIISYHKLSTTRASVIQGICIATYIGFLGLFLDHTDTFNLSEAITSSLCFLSAALILMIISYKIARKKSLTHDLVN